MAEYYRYCSAWRIVRTWGCFKDARRSTSFVMGRGVQAKTKACWKEMDYSEKCRICCAWSRGAEQQIGGWRAGRGWMAKPEAAALHGKVLGVLTMSVSSNMKWSLWMGRHLYGMSGDGKRLVVTGKERRCRICVSGRREPIPVRQGKQNSQYLKAEEVLPEFWPRWLGPGHLPWGGECRGWV